MRIIAATMSVVLVLTASGAFAQSGDATRGERLFNQQCKACHTVEKGGRNGVGPNLSGIFGSKAGAIEAVALAMALKDQVLPPTINQTHPDPYCDLDYVPNTARETPVKTAISTSFGFGGQNGALVMRTFNR